MTADRIAATPAPRRGRRGSRGHLGLPPGRAGPGAAIWLTSPAERRFVLVANRFRWENCARPPTAASPSEDRSVDAPFAPRNCRAYERVHCGVVLRRRDARARRGFDADDRGRILELLAIAAASRRRGRARCSPAAPRSGSKADAHRLPHRGSRRALADPWRPQHHALGGRRLIAARRRRRSARAAGRARRADAVSGQRQAGHCRCPTAASSAR